MYCDFVALLSMFIAIHQHTHTQNREMLRHVVFVFGIYSYFANIMPLYLYHFYLMADDDDDVRFDMNTIAIAP